MYINIDRKLNECKKYLGSTAARARLKEIKQTIAEAPVNTEFCGALIHNSVALYPLGEAKMAINEVENIYNANRLIAYFTATVKTRNENKQLGSFNFVSKFALERLSKKAEV